VCMKKKIIIFSCFGGGGHVAAAKALHEYLHDTYDLGTSYIFAEILKKYDPSYWFSFGTITSEQVYNFFIAGRWNRLLNAIYFIGSIYIKLFQRPITNAVYRFIQQEKTDLIISVIPFLNNIFLQVAQRADIPFLLLPTDLDTTTFIYNFRNPDYTHFRIGLPFASELIKNTLTPADIPPNQVSVVGALVRSDFFTQKNINAIKQRYHVPLHKPVVLLLMGAAGSYASYRYLQQLIKVQTPLHILVVLGRNHKARIDIESVPLPAHISITIFGFTQHIADLMTIADVGIIKSGSMSVCEAIYSNLPMLLDATSTILRWERLNHTFVKQYDLGQSIHNYADTPALLEKMLQPKNQAHIRHNLTQVKKKSTPYKIKNLVANLLI